jgi:hypothetical protein
MFVSAFFLAIKNYIHLTLGFAMSFGQFIALASFILSAGTIAVTYWVGIAQETVEVCVPFITGCTDITYTGLAGDAGFIFRGGLVSGCVFILMWWHCMRVWLQPSIQTRASRINLNLMTFFGMLAAVGLIWGTAVLAPTKVLWGPHIRGANTFFEGILLALSFNFYLIWRGRKDELLEVPSFKFKAVLFVLIWIVLVAFVANSVGEHMKRGTKIAEWWATLLICLYFLSSYWDWKKIKLQVG